MAFLRRISHAAGSILPGVPNSSGSLPRHIPRRATETFRNNVIQEENEDEDEEEGDTNSRASWELSDSESAKSEASGSGSDSDSEGRRSHDSSSSGGSSDSEMGDDGRPRDRFDMMTRHLWGVGERQGWFRDPEFDGLVSIRWVGSSWFALTTE